MMVYDLADPNNPEEVFRTADFSRRDAYVDYSWCSDNLQYEVGNHGREMIVYSLDDPSHPEYLGHWDDWGQGRYDRFFVYNSIIYFLNKNVDGVGGIGLHSVENPLEPEEIDRIEFDHEVTDIYLDDEIVYLTCYGEGLYCLSLEDPYHPEVVGYYDTPGGCEQVITYEGNVYIADNMELGIYHLDYEPGQNSDFTIQLNNGWNMISSPYIPQDQDIETIFRRLALRGNLFLVKDYMGRFYYPGEFNGIPFWDVNQGYQVKLNYEDRLWITGEEVEVNRSILLPEGWSMVSYFPVVEAEPETAFANIADQLIRVKDGDGNFYTPEWDFNNIPPLHRGAGYQVKTSEEVDLVWNVEGDFQAAHPVSPSYPTHFVSVRPTGRNMSILLKENRLQGEIGVFTLGRDSILGLCIGSAVLSETGDIGIAVWGDDITTEIIDGAVEGQGLTFRYWDGVAEYDMAFEPILGEAVWKIDDILVGKLAVQYDVPNDFRIQSIYPNPFNSSISITYNLPMTTPVSLSLYDLSGRQLKTLVKGDQHAGVHRTTFTTAALPSGLYFVRLEASGHMTTKKVTLIK